MAWGFAEVLPEKVSVLAVLVERAGEIDVNRAQQSLSKAEDLLKSAQTEEEFSVATAKVQRAEARIGVAARKET